MKNRKLGNAGNSCGNKLILPQNLVRKQSPSRFTKIQYYAIGTG